MNEKRLRARRRDGVALATLALVCVLALVLPRTAGAGQTEPAPACADAVIADWSDGRIDSAYPTTCYLEALDSLPEDMRAYTSAPDDIARALRTRLAQRAGQAADPGASGRPGESGPARSLQGGTATGDDDRRVLPPRVAPSASSLALPVLLVGALVLAVACGGIAGLLVRRIRVRRLAHRVAVEAGAQRARPIA